MPMISIDEFLNDRKDYVKDGGIVLRAFKSPSSWDPETRTSRFTLSAQLEDRDRDIIHQEGLSTEAFERNPVALMFHNSRSWPIGQWSDVTKLLSGRPKRTEATLTLLPEGDEPDADRAARHIAAGTLRTCSIGFLPIEIRRREVPEDKRDQYFYPGYEILAAELVEASIVPVPSLREALVKAAGGSGDDDFVAAREVIEQVLDTWAKHPETGLLIPRAEFEAAWKEATGHRQVVTFSPQAEAGFFEKLSSHLGKIIGKDPKTPEPATADPAAQKAAADRAKALSERMAAKNLAA